MPQKNDRLVIGTNLWISYLLSGSNLEFAALISQRRVTLLFSKGLLDEFIQVASRPKFRKYFSPKLLERFVFEISRKAKFIKVTSSIKRSRDEKDNFLLALAMDGKATHLLTGDKDLLVLKKQGQTKILTLSQYLSK